MEIRNILFVLVTYLVTTSLSFADQIVYQPGTDEGIDVWFSSSYNPDGVDDDKLQVGGWSDEYRSLIRFNLNCLPDVADSAYLYLYAYPRGDSSVPVSMNVYLLTSQWDESSNFYDPLSGYFAGTVGAPTPGSWYVLNITSIYNGWKDGTYDNHGFAFLPTSTNNEFNVFRSSDYTADPSLRPKLVVNYNQSFPFGLCFPMKLDGYTPYKTPVTSVMDHDGGFNTINGSVEAYNGEIGNVLPYDYGGGVIGYKKESLEPFVLPLLEYEDGVSESGKDYLFYDGHTGYDYRAPIGTPVYATADGVVTVIGDQWNTVLIDHNGNGYETYYLHFSEVLVSDGQNVKKGDLIGKSGDKGVEGNPHLHVTIKYFGVRTDPYGDGVNNILWKEKP